MNIKKLFKKNKIEKTLTLSEEIEELEKDIEKTKNALNGIMWFVLASFFSAVVSTLVKILMQKYTTFQVTSIHCLIAVLFFVPFIFKDNFKLVKTKKFNLHLIRGIFTTLVSILWFYSLKKAPLPEAISLKFATPIFITFLAIIFLKEKVRLSVIFSLLFGFAGILIIVRPKFEIFKYTYFLILTSAFISALYHLTVKKLTKTDSSTTISFYTFVTVGLLSLPFAIFNFPAISLKDLWLFAILSIVSIGYVKSIAVAYSKTDMSILQPFDFMRLVFASILSLIFFNIKTNPWTVVGSIIILTSSSFLAINKKYEHKLTKSKKMIKKLMEAKSNFFANINHELRTPLNAILGFSKIIKEKNKGKGKGKETYQFTKQIESAGEHLLGIVSNILDATKLEKNKMVLNEEDCDLLNEIIKPCIKMLEIKSKEKNIDLILTNKKNLNYLVFVDKLKMKQVLINLISNAIKFTNNNGKVTVKLKKNRNNDLAISIKDNGIGIKQEDIPLILQEYMQTNEGIKREQGTGLGLPISKKIAELHNCQFLIKSTFGKGTKITIIFPKKRVKKEIETTGIKAKTNIAKKRGKKNNYDFPNKKIMIVDDNYANNLVLEKTIKLKKITDNIIIVSKAKKVMSVVKKEKPNLLILDQNLNSQLTGSSIANVLKTDKKFKKLPIIMLTADTFEEDIKKIMKESKAEAYLEKPIDFNKLDEKIRDLFKKS